MRSAATAAVTIVAVGAFLAIAAPLGLSAATIGVGMVVIALAGAISLVIRDARSDATAG